MQAEKTIFQELHLVVDEGLRHTLHDLRQEADERSLSKFISGVLKLFYPWLEHEVDVSGFEFFFDRPIGALGPGRIRKIDEAV